jgi:protoheme IX farnesyltransferase
MLPGIDPSGARTGAVMVFTAAALIPAGVVAGLCVGGWGSAVVAALLGGFFLWRSVGFVRERTDQQARRVLRASLVYLPIVFTVLLIDAFATR